MSKDVIFCADGTWNGPGEADGDAAPRLARFPAGWLCHRACWIASQAAMWSPRGMRLRRICRRI